jgi:hypothetical protein
MACSGFLLVGLARTVDAEPTDLPAEWPTL